MCFFGIALVSLIITSFRVIRIQAVQTMSIIKQGKFLDDVQLHPTFSAVNFNSNKPLISLTARGSSSLRAFHIFICNNKYTHVYIYTSRLA